MAAERVAATVAQGVHGRRRVGQGDSFWQFRRFVAGDPVGRIDWRQSAKSGRGPGRLVRPRNRMGGGADRLPVARRLGLDALAVRAGRGRTSASAPDLLLLALASLLLRGGERVRC